MRIENKRLVPTEQAPIVVEIFERFISTRSLGAVQRWLRGEGFNFSKMGIWHILKNERYAGFIVPEKTYETAVEILRQRSQRNAALPAHRTYLFSGLVFCGYCGRPLNANGSYERYYYYRCRTDGCEMRSFREDKLESYLLENLRELLEEEVRIRSANRTVDRTPALKAQISRLQELYIEGLIDKGSFTERYTALTAALQEQKPTEIPNVDKITAPLALYGTFSTEAKKAFWSHIIKKVTLTAEVKAVEFRI